VPEGDTVWLAARNLDRALAGSVLEASDFRIPQWATTDLSGHAVLGVVSRGKHLLFRIDPDVTLHTHFRMDGSWHLYRRPVQAGLGGQLNQGGGGARPTRRHGGPDHEVRVVLRTREWEAVGFRLPVVELLPTAEEHRVVGHLGPDLLGDDFELDEAVRRIGGQPERAIGEALLDQRNLAGIGNLYKAEVLFLSGLSPWRAASAVPDVARVVVLARRLLLANRCRSSQVTTGDQRRGHETWVYGRAGRPCRRCGTAVRQAEQGDQPHARLTWWCPSCQS
jgi:endonuclease-8